jgi:anhydro-N-acetylmuramic acid kinase
MIVAGIMSGTSADGINVALVRIEGRGLNTRLQLLAHREYPYPAQVRRAVLAAMNARRASVAELARLNFLLPELYAEAVQQTLHSFQQSPTASPSQVDFSLAGTKKRRSPASSRAAALTCELVGCHGQTLYHQGEPAPYLGRRLSTTWQVGDGSVLAARLRLPVVSDFRPADLAAGGQGAPLVPYLDYLLFRHPRRGRILQNIGGIANLTAIPAGAKPGQVTAFDTGPGNMVIDALARELFRKPFDRDGALAGRGQANSRLLAELLGERFFRRPPPKTAGREQFGREFTADFLRRCRGMNRHDVLATATALTAESIAASVRAVLAGLPASPLPGLPGRLSQRARFHDFFVSGGGANNKTLMRMLADRLTALQLRIATTDEQGLPAPAKEAVAFAVLAYQTWQRQASNIPSATGAGRPAILGKVSYV